MWGWLHGGREWAVGGMTSLSQFSHSAVSTSLRPHEPHSMPASLSITNSQSPPKPMSIESVMPSNRLIHCFPLLLQPSIFPSIRVFSLSQFFASGGQRIGVSASTSVLLNEHFGLICLRMDWLDLLASKGLSRVFSNTSVQKHPFFGTQLSLRSNSHIHT